MSAAHRTASVADRERAEPGIINDDARQVLMPWAPEVNNEGLHA